MTRIAYVNGQYRLCKNAQVHIEDRGYQFADGVYEVIAVQRGDLIDDQRHIDRLFRSLDAIRLSSPVSEPVLRLIIARVIEKNRLENGLVYFQVTRGVSRRTFGFPKGVRPSLVVYVQRSPLRVFTEESMEKSAVSVKTCPDQRWARRDIKSIALLPNVLAKQSALEAGCFEAWMYDENNMITEGGSSTSWIVNHEGVLVTRQLSSTILPGVTRHAIYDIIKELGLKFEERAFSVEEAKSSREAFLASATTFVMPVVRIDEYLVGNGKVGEISKLLFQKYLLMIKESNK